MKQVLLITPEEVRNRTSLDANIEDDKIINTIILVQDLTIESILGSVMFDEIKAQVIANNLDSKYTTLLDHHVRKVLISAILVRITLFLVYRFNNTGVVKNKTDKQEILSASELKTLRDEAQEPVKTYSDRLTAFLKANTATYPLYDDVVEGETVAAKLSNNVFYNGD